MDIRSEISAGTIVLVILKKEEYGPGMFRILNELNGIFLKTLYVSLTQPYKSLAERFRKNNLDDGRFTFIDVLTSTVREPDKEANCVFVSSPSALTELSVVFSKTVNEHKCEAALFDSIQNLTIYEDQNAVMKFVHNILTKSQLQNTRLFFICLKEDKDLPLIKDLYTFVDKVIDLTVE